MSTPAKHTVTGIIELNKRGDGYIVIPEVDADLLVPKDYTLNAFYGDTVEAEIIEETTSHRKEGRVIKIIKRNREVFVGTIQKTKKTTFVIPDSKRIHRDFYLPPNESKKVQDRDKVVISITDWGSVKDNPTATITTVLGKKGDHDTEVNSIVIEKGFKTSFPPDALREAQETADAEKPIPESEIKKRHDFRNTTTLTIDPVDAKDFDDALSFRKLESGNIEVGIHIADVSHYVKEGSALDREARERSFSVYLVDRTIPMLPEILSNDLCSLNPGEDKLAFSAVFTFAPDLTIIDKWFGRTIINSNKRFTYEEAQAVLDTGEGPYSTELKELERIALELRKEKKKHGAIDFATEEVRFDLDEKGVPIRIRIKKQIETNRLIEDFMLLANKEVAEYVYTAHKKALKSSTKSTFLYRIHDAPDHEKIENLGIFLRALGYEVDIDKKDNVTSKDLQMLLKKIEGKANEALIRKVAVKSMSKAIYSTKNIGHFGLAFQYYTHFTSPIRRYPDLIVHRLLQKELNGQKVDTEAFARYTRIAKEASEKEIQASEAERESIKYKQVEFMQKFVGNTFKGTINGVTEWGLYIEEVNTKAEGMVRLADIDGDYYELDKKTYSIVGKKTGKRITLGDVVTFKVTNADLDKKILDYALVDENATPLK